MTDTTGGLIRVLHVDDNMHDRELVRDALEQDSRGFAVHSASSLAECRQLLEQHDIDIVLTDYNLSGIDGLRLLETVKQEYPRLPVVMLTGTGSEEVAVEALKKGAADYLLKTVKGIRRLGTSIGNVLDEIRTREDLAFKNAILKTMLETSREGILVTRPDGRIVSYNRRFLEIWQIPAEAMDKGTEDLPLQLVTEKLVDPQHFLSSIQYLYEHQEEESFEEIQLKDERILERYSASMIGEDGTWYGRSWYFQDITERKRAEQKILRLNRMLRFQSAINSLIVHATDREHLFNEACRIAVKKGKFRFAWIGIVPSSGETAVPQAWAGHEAGYLQYIRDSSTPEDPSLVNLVYLNHGEVVINDLGKHPGTGNMNKEALSRGYRGVAALPLWNEEEIIGVFALYAAEPGFFDAEEMALLRELTGDIAYAVNNLIRQDRLDYLASYDPLTGLSNRIMFYARLNYLMTEAEQKDSGLALLIFCIRRFHHINNIYGFQTGDNLLCEMAERLKALVQNRNNISRIAADTFALILTDLHSEEEVHEFFDDTLLAGMSKAFHIGDSELSVRVWGGFACYPAHGQDADTLYRHAEVALKAAKAANVNHQVFQPQMAEQIGEIVHSLDELKNAFNAGEFVLHYQPRFTLIDEAISGVEALIRWQHPQHGLLNPADFMPLMEESGLILESDLWAMQQATDDYRAWQRKLPNPPRINVNISSALLRHRNFIEMVGKAVSRDNDPVPVTLKIAERLIMHDIKDTLHKLQAARKAGMQVIIDDFGIGASALSYLARIPADYLKIDRSFIHTMTEQPESMTIVSTIVTLAHALDMKVIAGGVETEEQVKYLRLLRCDEMQGYLYSRPLPAEEISATLKNGKLSGSVTE